jgi:hypothetical protein
VEVSAECVRRARIERSTTVNGVAKVAKVVGVRVATRNVVVAHACHAVVISASKWTMTRLSSLAAL